jgi:hypothetical protein
VCCQRPSGPVCIHGASVCPSSDGGDAAASGGAPAEAGATDAGRYCVYDAPGAGGTPSTHCLPLPRGCASCACITLPYSYCTCSEVGGEVLVRCLGA